MHVTKCRWCDFVVWSPLGSPFIQRIEYDAAFMKGTIIKAQKFYFEQFLPAVVPHITVPLSIVSSNSVSTIKKSTSVQPKSTRQFFNDRTSFNASVTKPSSTAVHCETVQNTCTSQLQTNNTVSSDVQILRVKQSKSMSLDAVLRTLHIVKHAVKGDGSCLYHAISHQAGLISNTCPGDENISMHLRKIALEVTNKHPTVRLEGNYSKLEWLKKQQEIVSSNSWGGDLEIRLLAIGLHRDIVVITATSNGSTFARMYPSKPPPLEKMKGGVFNPVSYVINGTTVNLLLYCYFLMVTIIMIQLYILSL